MSKRKLQAGRGDNECCVCLTAIIGKAGKLPCGHDQLCVDCIVKVFTTSGKCPLCRWTPSGRDLQSSASCEHWTQIGAGRLMVKMTDTPEKLQWMTDGLRHFNMVVPSTVSTLTLCCELSRQMHYETDEEED